MWFDKFFNLLAVAEDTLKRPFIAIGMASFLLMVPLALTSTNNMVKRLGGKQWNRLHRLVYVAAIGGVVHYWMLVKADTRIPVGFGIALAVLLIYRIVAAYFPRPARVSRT
jgi:sulfoxide reductase heme-binding subunit YedZ